MRVEQSRVAVLHLASVSSFGFMDSVLFRLVLWRPGQEPSDVVLAGVAFALSAQLSSTPTTTSAREGAALLQTLAKRSLGAFDFSFFVRYVLDFGDVFGLGWRFYQV